MSELLARLESELKQAVADHYRKLKAEAPDVYGYAILSEDGVSSIAPVANRESSLSVDPTDRRYNYYRLLAVEWSEYDDYGLFERVNAIVGELHDDDSSEFSAKGEAILRICLNVLRDLEREGLFGPRTDQRFLAICLSDSDDDIMLESAKLLNTPATFAAYAAEF